MEKLDLSGTAFDWKPNTMEWRVSLEGEKATEEWLLSLWKKNEANILAIRRPKYYGHLKKGWDTTLITKGISACAAAHKGALISLMSGDTYTDSTANKSGQGADIATFAGNPMPKSGTRCGNARALTGNGQPCEHKPWEIKDLRHSRNSYRPRS